MERGIDYGRLMQQALRRLVADVLAETARHGLPGKHHFFITFDTNHPGVDMPASLRARFPADMTIVLHEWFENLAVMNDRFSVTLNFGEVPETLVIPFEAIKTFVDPSVEFGLRLKKDDEPEERPLEFVVEDDAADDDVPEEHGTVIPFHPSRRP